MSILVDAAGVTVRRADRLLFGDLSVTISDGDRLGVVGINGTGKSTLLRVLSGTQEPEEGQVRRGRGVRIGVLDQDAALPEGTVRQVVSGIRGNAVGGGNAVGDGNAVGGGSAGRPRDGNGDGPGRSAGGPDRWEAEAVLDRLGMAPVMDRQVSELSGGQAKRVALARVIVEPAELLVLDEPTNHLDLPAIAWLEAWLARFAGGVVMVSHDRHLLDRVTTRMIELDRGRGYVHDGGYAGYLAARADREGRAVEAESVRRNLARQELAWLRRGAPARTRKPRARIDAALEIVQGRPEAAARAEALDIGFDTPRLGNKVIEVYGADAGYPGGPPVLTDIRLDLDPRERLGIVGSNGSGKSTVLELLAGRLSPLRGQVDAGVTARVGYYAQHGPELDSHGRVRDLVAGSTRVPGDPSDKRLMERFWFSGELPWATVGTLSGGERRRLQLLLVLAERPNVLLLDEPTNDLDLDTLRALEEFLDGWPGALVTVSHDRTFLDRVTERIVACRDGTVGEVPGGLAAWIAEATAGRPPRKPEAGPATKSEARRPAMPAVEQTPRGRSQTTIGFELRKLDKEMVRLTRDRDRLAERFQTTSDHRELATIGADLATAQAALDDAEERWLALAEEAESSRSVPEVRQDVASRHPGL